MVGYVDEITQKKTFYNKEKEKSFDVFKFVINNNDGVVIQCNVFDNHIKIFENKIKINEVWGNYNL